LWIFLSPSFGIEFSMIFPHSGFTGVRVFRIIITIKNLSLCSIHRLVILMLTPLFSVKQELHLFRYLRKLDIIILPTAKFLSFSGFYFHVHPSRLSWQQRITYRKVVKCYYSLCILSTIAIIRSPASIS
jgi:hypothetical protein